MITLVLSLVIGFAFAYWSRNGIGKDRYTFTSTKPEPKWKLALELLAVTLIVGYFAHLILEIIVAGVLGPQ